MSVAGRIRTFDLVNCGKNNRYTINNLIVHNSDNYGSGITKKFRTLKLLGFNYTYNEVEYFHKAFAKAYQGAKDYGRKLEAEWKRNNGFVLNPLGIPTPVNERYMKDLTNRCTQSAGHHILMLFLYKIARDIREAGLKVRYFIHDFHDETMIQFRAADIARGKEIYSAAVSWVNDLLSANVILKAEPQVAGNLAEIKCEGYLNEDEDLRDLIEELNID